MGGVSALNDPNVMDILGKWAGGSKICVLSVDPTAQYDMYLINEKSGKWDDTGVWWSNQNHIPKTYPTTYYSATTHKDSAWKDDYTDDYAIAVDNNEALPIDTQCPWCMGIGDMFIDPYYCIYCESCFECGTEKDVCMCWNPDKAWYDEVNVRSYGY